MTIYCTSGLCVSELFVQFMFKKTQNDFGKRVEYIAQLCTYSKIL